MKIYVAARFSEKELVRTLYERLGRMGHEISADWTLHKNVKPYHKNQNIAGEYAVEDESGVRNADVLMLITSPEPGTGVSAELGVAIASKELTGKPIILVIGDYISTNAFFFHPAVSRVPGIEDALKQITGIAADSKAKST